MPPWSGTGICCRRPDAMYGPSSALMRATSRAPNRSGHINAPSRSSNSSCAAVSRGTPPSRSDLPSLSNPRGSSQPKTVTQWRRASYCIGMHKCVQSSDHSLERICPLTSSSCSRCITTISGERFGSFMRVVDSSFHQFSAVLRSASLSACSVLCGSSMRIISPPMPSSEPPTDVASREPPALVSNFVLVFWSSLKLKRCPHSDWYQGLRMSRRVRLLLVSDNSWLYEPHKNRTCGPRRNDTSECAQVQAGYQMDPIVVFPQRGGMFTNKLRICPSETAALRHLCCS